MTKHKSGPWMISQSGNDTDPGKISIEVGDGEYFICQVDGGMHQQANAKLIAAAPELLSSLEALIASWDDLKPGESIIVDAARAAIAKATA